MKEKRRPSFSTVTIGFVPRERFSSAAKALKKIYKHTHIPFKLIIVDCNIPKRYMRAMKAVLKDRSNYKIIRTNKYLMPNQSKNLILKHTRDEYLCLIENDCYVSAHWLSWMISACEAYPVAVVTPALFESPAWLKGIHFDRYLGSVKTWKKGGKVFRTLLPNGSIKHCHRWKEPQKVEGTELHCVLFKRNVVSKIGLFDEQLSTREPIDFTLALRKAKIPLILEPNVRVIFRPPPPIYKDEFPFFHFVWDMQSAIASHERVRKKWNIIDMPSSLPYVKGQLRRTNYAKWWLHRSTRIWPRIKSILNI